MSYLRPILSQTQTPQSEPIPGSDQVANSAGGYAFPVDDWQRLRRFLVLGSEGGSYYASERTLSVENAKAVARCIAADGPRTVAEVVEVSTAGRAPKNDPALYALSLCLAAPDQATRQAAYAAIPQVARIGTHLLHLAAYLEQQRGWSRGLRRAFAGWFLNPKVEDVAYQAVKYPSRDGWALSDLLRLAHPKTADPKRAALFKYVVDGAEAFLGEPIPQPNGSELTVRPYLFNDLPALVVAVEHLKAEAAHPKKAAAFIREYRIPREAVPTELLKSPDVWDALLQDMPITATIRNLATMTRVGLLTPMSAASKTIRERITDEQKLTWGRVHPIQVLAALMTYQSGRGARNAETTWTPVREIVDALDAAFYRSFGAVEPSGKRTFLALDVSASMTWSTIAGVPGLTPRQGSAAMAMVTAAAEPEWFLAGFSSHETGLYTTYGSRVIVAGMQQIDISPRMRLNDVVNHIERVPAGGTDCSLPMQYAQERKIAVDTFVVYTDSETWAGAIHPVQALRQYRQASGIDARLVVVGMVSNGFSIADPRDGGMLDVVGFDTATPNVIADFSRGLV